jgi:hypothetical protein
VLFGERTTRAALTRPVLRIHCLEGLVVDHPTPVAQYRSDPTGSIAPDELTEREIQALVARCPEQQRWAFEGWLRGVRHLDGDPIVGVS